MHKYELTVLEVLKGNRGIALDGLVSKARMGKDEVMWALENLKEKGLVAISYGEHDRVTINEEGKEYARDGLPEERLLKEVEIRKIKASALGDKERIGLQWGKRLGLIEISGGVLRLTEKGTAAVKTGVPMGELLRELYKNPNDRELIARCSAALPELSKRRLVSLERHAEIISIEITKAGLAAIGGGAAEANATDQIDRSMIASGSWAGKKFKRYDIDVRVDAQIPAMKHPLKRLIDQVKDAYVSLGYREMSGPAVESSFWVFDSLFVPQDHPARDAQDTFYTANLENARLGNLPHIKTVKEAHRKGWHSDWDEEVAGRMLLRTHTTSVSSRHIYGIIDEIRQDPERYALPIKLFSVGRVFRNESVDYKHLADFYQHDGIVIGKDLTLSNLFDELTKIYGFLGIKIKFKPSYFPFVEPGTEFLAYYEKNDEWIEIGGAGVIREEITGVSRSKLSVLAWGPGLDRSLLIKDRSIPSISELYNGGMGWLRNRQEV